MGGAVEEPTQYDEDPAYERLVSSNGAGRLSTLAADNPEALLDGYSATDLGNAHRLVTIHGDSFRYVHEWGWHVWSGARWSRDRTDLMMRFAKDTCRSMIVSAGELLRLFKEDKEHKDDLKAAKKLIEHAEQSSSSRRLAAMVELARSEASSVARPVLFDSDPFMLNCSNCTVDLKTGEAHPHERVDYLTKLCPTRYDPEARAPAWEKFLLDVFGDASLINYMARVIGYSLSGSPKEQAVFILHGTGSNGKSTLLNTCLRVLGEDYAAQIDAASITGGRRSGASNDIARLRGMRFVSSIEVGEGRQLNEALVKQFSGGDKIAARFLYKEFFEFQPEFKLFIAANHKPEVKGQDHAIWRRVRLIPFKKTFTEEMRDPEIQQRLLAEAPGILAWAVRGCMDWIRSGLVTPDVVKEATLAYRDEMNELADFLDTYTWRGPELSCSTGDLYARYREWAETRHDKPLSSTAFGRRLHDLGLESGKDRGVRVWHGISTSPPPRRIDQELI